MNFCGGGRPTRKDKRRIWRESKSGNRSRDVRPCLFRKKIMNLPNLSCRYEEEGDVGNTGGERKRSKCPGPERKSSHGKKAEETPNRSPMRWGNSGSRGEEGTGATNSSDTSEKKVLFRHRAEGKRFIGTGGIQKKKRPQRGRRKAAAAKRV